MAFIQKSIFEKTQSMLQQKYITNYNEFQPKSIDIEKLTFINNKKTDHKMETKEKMTHELNVITDSINLYLDVISKIYKELIHIEDYTIDGLERHKMRIEWLKIYYGKFIKEISVLEDMIIKIDIIEKK